MTCMPAPTCSLSSTPTVYIGARCATTCDTAEECCFSPTESSTRATSTTTNFMEGVCSCWQMDVFSMAALWMANQRVRVNTGGPLARHTPENGGMAWSRVRVYGRAVRAISTWASGGRVTLMVLGSTCGAMAISLFLFHDDSYVGELKESLKHGFGVEDFLNGDRYSGNYLNGRPCGTGEYSWQNGAKYKGSFKNGLRYGRGWSVL